MSKNKLYIHKRNTHDIERMKTCDKCGKAFPHNTKLEIHIDRVHPESGPKNFSCELCDKSFIYERSLKQHKYSCTKQEWIHDQKRRYKLGLTKKVTVHRPRTIRVVKSSNPPKMQPTKCDYCDIVFERRNQICRHYKEFHPGKPILIEGKTIFSTKIQIQRQRL